LLKVDFFRYNHNRFKNVTEGTVYQKSGLYPL